MNSIFRSKQYKLVLKLLENHGFNSKDFKQFKMGNIAREVIGHSLLPQFIETIKQHKMTHLKLLKATLIVLHMLQISERIQQNPQIQEIIRQLQMRTKVVMHYSKRKISRSLSYSDKRISQNQWSGNSTMKQIYDGNDADPQENIHQNSVSYLLGKLVQPLLHIEEKVLYSHELIYKPKTNMDSYTCWATLNLLKKYSELSHTIEEIGRYYKDYNVAMVSTIKVLSLDIRTLYRRVAGYLKKQCGAYQVMIQLHNILPFEMDQEYKIKQVVMLVQELQTVNENVRILYCNKYFWDSLALNHIYMPTIFNTGEDNLEVLFSFLELRNNMPSREPQYRVPELISPPKLNKCDYQLERVESI